jgi:membrane fusion protein, multidrug efflux system
MKRAALFTVLILNGASVVGQTSPSSVETTKVIAKALQKVVTIPGDLTPYQGVNLNARVSGFVESLAVDRGSWVKRGQVLATISAPELRAQRAEAEAKVQGIRAQEAEAEAKTVAAQSTYERLKAASATPGVVAVNDVEIAQRGLEATRAHVNALKGSGGAAEAAVKAVQEMKRTCG